MPIKLSRALKQARTIDVGWGVTMTFRRISYAEFVEAEAWSHRTARERLNDTQKARLEGLEFDALEGEFKDKLIGMAAEMLLDRLVMQFGTGWTGVFTDESEGAAPLNEDTWRQFREVVPLVCADLARELMAPMQAVFSEGKDYAPLPNTASAEA